MFNFFNIGTSKEYQRTAKDIYNMTNESTKEYYRVGRTEDGMTTLTILMDGGMSTTVTMNQNACKQMIRMLESTFNVEEPFEETQE